MVKPNLCGSDVARESEREKIDAFEGYCAVPYGRILYFGIRTGQHTCFGAGLKTNSAKDTYKTRSDADIFPGHASVAGFGKSRAVS